MGQALYRKYRSKSLAEIVGQEHITTTLARAIKKGTFSHAYLLTGPRGTGKTSIARIMAHELNGLSYDEGTTHLDIIEIDAASNRRIDEIRTLRERVHNAPANAAYKVYIIDEVHMLTKEAFNALLKTLEEPPAHAIFILATTEAHKLPETIVSRTQRFSFRPVEKDKVVAHLRHIATQEKITISDEALGLVAEHGRGSFRDSISLLDQLSNTSDKVELDDVRRTLGAAPEAAVESLMANLTTTPAEVLDTLQQLYSQGYQAPQLAKQLAGVLRKNLITRTDNTLSADASTQLLKKLLDVPASHDPAGLLEIVLLDIVLQQAPQTIAQPPTLPPPPKSSAIPKAPQPPKPSKAPSTPNTQTNSSAQASIATTPTQETTAAPTEAPQAPMLQSPAGKQATPTPTAGGSFTLGHWQEVLDVLRKNHNTLYSVTRMAKPTLKNNELTLAFEFPFHQKRINDVKNKQIISDLINQTTGIAVVITCVLSSAQTDSPTEAEQPDGTQDIPSNALEQPVARDASGNPLETISNIFGGAEVLE